MTDYDDILEVIGGFGLYQRLVSFVLLGLFNYYGAFNIMIMAFLSATPDHWCYSKTAHHLNLTRDTLRNLTIPHDVRMGVDVYSQCLQFDVNYTDWTNDDVWSALNNGSLGAAPITKCTDGWTYDTSQFTSTTVTEWDLVCDRSYLSAVSSSVYMVGLMVGGSVFGIISDWYGRKMAWSLSLVLIVISGTTTSFAPNYWVFITGRFLMGCGGMGNCLAAFILGVEIVNKKWRVFISLTGNYIWSVFLIMLAGIAYFLRDWKTLSMAVFLPQILNLGTIYFFPESPRWLYSKNKHVEADKLVRKIARVNGVKALPKNLNVEIKKDPTSGAICDLFRHKSLRYLTLKICFQWFTSSMVYYGLSLSSSNLAGNPYVNFAIGGALELPAAIVAHICIEYIGRKKVLISAMLACGVVLLTTPLLPQGLDGLQTALTLSGRFFISIGFTTTYIFSAELFPTVNRSVALSVGSTCARIGGIIAPFLASLIGVNRFIPYISFGVLAMMAGVLAFLLPETKGSKLPDYIVDVDRFIRTGAVEATRPEEEEVLQAI